MTDITGYRERGGLPSESGNTLGGAGQSALSAQVHRILTPKLPLLNTPGSVLENTIYYDVNSSSVSVLEEQASFAKDRISLNSVALGSTSTAYIPSFLFAGNVWWVGSLKSSVIPTTTNDRIQANQGYGFNLLRNIIIYMGSSNIAQLQLSGIANFMIAMACCETKGKRSEVIEGAGKLLNAVNPYSPLAVAEAGKPFFRYKTAGNYYIATTSTIPDKDLAQFTVPLRLPWTSLSVVDKRLSLDTKLLTQPIQIILDVMPQSSAFTVTGSSDFIASFQELEYSTLQLYQEELTDKSMSVRNELLALPEFNVGLPFQYPQAIDFNIPSSNDTGKSDYRFEVNLSSIINSDLTTFLFMVTSDYMSSLSTDAKNFEPLYGMRLLDLELKLNGQRFFNFDGDIFKYVYLSKTMDCYTPEFYGSFMKDASNIDPVILDSYIYELNNSRLRAIIAESHLQNTCRFTNQTFQLSFKIDRTVNWPYVTNVESKKGFTLRMCYLFNGVFLIGGDGGTSKLITN